MKYRWDGLDPDDFIRLRDYRLRRQVRFQLYAYSPFYKKAFDQREVRVEIFRGAADLGKLPLTTRTELAVSPEDFVLKPSTSLIHRWGSSRQVFRGAIDRMLRGAPHAEKELANQYDPVHVLETSGTSGEPLPIHLSRRDLASLGLQGSRMLEVAGIARDDVVVNLLDPVSSGGFWPVWLGAVTMGIRQVAPGALEPEEAVSLVRKTSAQAVVARAEDAAALLEAAGDEGIPGVRTLVLAPQLLPASLRSRLTEQARQIRIVETYGFAEGRTLWAQCVQGCERPDAGFHLSSDFDLIETISRVTGEAAGPGEAGEIAFTGLDQRGTALARYQPGDFAEGGIRVGRCPYCGRLVDRLIGPIHRSENLLQVRLEDAGEIVLSVEALARALAQPSISAWQVEIAKQDEDLAGFDEVYVIFNPKKDRDPARVALELDRAFRTETGFSPTQFVLSERASGGSGGVIDMRMVAVRDASPNGGDRRVRLWRMPPGNGRT